ncbi:MAG: MATE family efflux transporter [Oscillospiraceae bacterium]|nr:MATE family efflux transporter [Oscillospiraceae bacterium]
MLLTFIFGGFILVIINTCEAIFMSVKEEKISVKKSGKYEIDMCNGSIIKKMLIFTVPLMFSSMLQLLFNAADVIVVGRYAGKAALGAVGSTSSLINLLTNLFIGLSVSSNVLTARYFAAKQKEQLSKVVHTSMMLSIISGIFLTFVGVIWAPSILKIMNTPPEVLKLAVQYIRMYFVGMTAMMVYNFGSAILRAIGDTKRPLYFLMISGVVNVALNLLFVRQFNMSVLGVALATVIAQVISALCVVVCLVKEKNGIQLEFKKMKIDMNMLKLILKIGLPAGFQGCLFSLSNVFIQSAVNSFGDTVVAGNSAASNIEGFIYVAMNAFHQAAISFTSQNVGAGKYKRVNKILYVAQGCVLTVGLVLGIAVVLSGEFLLGLYTDEPAVIMAGMDRLKIICITYCLCGMMDVMVGMLRGLGYSVMPMIVSLIGACGLRILWLSTGFRLEQFHTTDMLYITYPVSWSLTLIAHIICYVTVKKKINLQKTDIK